MIHLFRRHPQYKSYFISDSGMVLSFNVKVPHFLKTGSLNSGYETASLGYRNWCLVHRLVLETFVGPCPAGMEACHRNDIKKDNRLANLYWGNHKTNCLDRMSNGHQRNGICKNDKNGMSKLTWEQVAKIRQIYANGGITYKELAKMYNVNKETIGRIIRNNGWIISERLF